MHQQLTEKRIACKDFIQALESCHADTWSKFTGGCNQTKIQLSKCLHEQSMKQASANRMKAREKRDRVELAWQELHQDDE